MTVRLHEVDWSALTADRGELDNGVGVVDVVDWLTRAQSAPRELHPYVGRHRAEAAAV